LAMPWRFIIVRITKVITGYVLFTSVNASGLAFVAFVIRVIPVFTVATFEHIVHVWIKVS
jgi:hypothetical protein